LPARRVRQQILIKKRKKKKKKKKPKNKQKKNKNKKKKKICSSFLSERLCAFLSS